MKKLFVIAAAALFSVGVTAQELGLVTIRAENPKFEKSLYIEFCENASQYTKVETTVIGTLKLPSVATLGGYIVSIEQTTDMMSNQSKRAVVLTPNVAAVSAVTNFLKKPGTVDGPNGYIVDESEIDPLLTALKKMAELQKNPTKISTSWTYYCRGGFAVSIGYNATLKTPIWLARVGVTGEMPSMGKDFDFVKMMMETFEKAKAELPKIGK